jgi:hypothetical protein
MRSAAKNSEKLPLIPIISKKAFSHLPPIVERLENEVIVEKRKETGKNPVFS